MISLKDTMFDDENPMRGLINEVDKKMEVILGEYRISEENYNLWRMFRIDEKYLKSSLDYCGIKPSVFVEKNTKLIENFGNKIYTFRDLKKYINKTCDFKVLYREDLIILNDIFVLKEIIEIQKKPIEGKKFKAINNIPDEIVGFLVCKFNMLKDVLGGDEELNISYEPLVIDVEKIFFKCPKICMFILCYQGKYDLGLKLLEKLNKSIHFDDCDVKLFHKLCNNQVGKYFLLNVFDFGIAWVPEFILTFDFTFEELINIYKRAIKFNVNLMPNILDSIHRAIHANWTSNNKGKIIKFNKCVENVLNNNEFVEFIIKKMINIYDVKVLIKMFNDHIHLTLNKGIAKLFKNKKLNFTICYREDDEDEEEYETYGKLVLHCKDSVGNIEINIDINQDDNELHLDIVGDFLDLGYLTCMKSFIALFEKLYRKKYIKWDDDFDVKFLKIVDKLDFSQLHSGWLVKFAKFTEGRFESVVNDKIGKGNVVEI